MHHREDQPDERRDGDGPDRSLRHARRRADGDRRRDQGRLPAAGPGLPSGRRWLRARRRASVQGDRPGLRDARPTGAAAGLRRAQGRWSVRRAGVGRAGQLRGRSRPDLPQRSRPSQRLLPGWRSAERGRGGTGRRARSRLAAEGDPDGPAGGRSLGRGVSRPKARCRAARPDERPAPALRRRRGTRRATGRGAGRAGRRRRSGVVAYKVPAIGYNPDAGRRREPRRPVPTGMRRR